MLKRTLDLRPRLVVYGFMEDHLRRNLSPCASSYAPFCTPVAYVAIDAEGKPFTHRPRHELFSLERNRKFYEEVTMRDRFTIDDVLWRARVDLFRVRESRLIQYPNDRASRERSLSWLLWQMDLATRKAGARLLVMYIPPLGVG